MIDSRPQAASLLSLRSLLSAPFDPLSRLERQGLYLLLAVVCVFGGLVEMRSAFLQRRLTDLTVYLRAAWAVRAGEPLYDIKDDNNFYYQYPPLLAILLVPLADPPADSGEWGVRFELSVALWYLFSIACLAYALHEVASCLEENSNDPRVRNQSRFCRRWWYMRTLPLLACFITTGQALARSQVSMMLLALSCGMVAALVRRQNLRAGVFLAGAICLKVIPAFLLLIPLWQRNLRCLLGCALGLFVMLGVIPAAVFGIPRTIQYYKEYDVKVIRAGVGHSHDTSRAATLTEITSTDSQSVMAIIHNSLYLDRPTRPRNATSAVKLIHWATGGLLTLISLSAAGWKPLRSARAQVLFLGLITMNMLLLSPVCHLHYYCLILPLVAGLIAVNWERTGTLAIDKPLACVLALNLITGLIPALPGMEVTRDIGLASYGQLVLWFMGCRALWHETRTSEGNLASRLDRACRPSTIATTA